MTRHSKESKALNRQIGKRLLKARLLRGLSQQKLAQLTEVTFQQVQKYESGMNGLGPARMISFARALGVTIDYLYGVEDLELPDFKVTYEKTLKLLQAIHRLEELQPASFSLLYHFIVGLADSACT